MAIALEQTVTGLDTGSDITLTSWTPAANELVLLFVAQRNEALVPSVSGNGLTWVSVATVDGNQGQNGLAVFRAMGASPTTGSITVTNVSGFDVAVACRFSGVDISGTNGSGAIDASATTAGPAVDDDDATISVTSLTDNAWALSVFTHRSATFTTPGGQTTISINNTNGSAGNITTCSVVRVGPVTPAGATTLGGTNSLNAANDWCAVAVAVKPAAANLTITPNAAQAASSATQGAIVLGSTSTTPSPAQAASSATGPTVILGSLALAPSAASAASSAVIGGVMAGDDLIVVPLAAVAVSSAPDPTTIQGSISITPVAPEAGTNALIAAIINVILLSGLIAAAGSAASIGSVSTSATTIFLSLPTRRTRVSLRGN